jgi:hypothetical protein
MSVLFNANLERVQFATNGLSTVVGHTQRSLMLWIVPTNQPSQGMLAGLAPFAAGQDGQFIYANFGGSSGRVAYFANWSGSTAVWYPTSATFSSGTLTHLAITYNGSSSGNAPTIYINGSPVSVTTSTAASGSLNTGTNSAFVLGSSFTNHANSLVHSFLYYNRVLSADEVVHAYESRLYVPNWNGLVFAPNLNGCAGNVHDGDVLGAGNTMVDMVGGVIGTPGSSPTFANNTVLSIGGE